MENPDWTSLLETSLANCAQCTHPDKKNPSTEKIKGFCIRVRCPHLTYPPANEGREEETSEKLDTAYSL